MRTGKRCMAGALLVAGALLAAAPAARAAEEAQRREVPDYDGRPAPGADAGDVALWVPRVLLFPLYLVSEYVVRRPLGALITTAEKNRWPLVLRNFFTFGPNREAGLFPVVYLDFGFRPSAGLRFFWNDAGAPGNRVRLKVATGGSDWLLAALTDSYALDAQSELGLRLSFLRRPDGLFKGLGPLATDDEEARYGFSRWELAGGYERFFGKHRGAWLRADGGVRGFRFREGGCCGDDSLREQVAAGIFPEPPGLGVRYTSPFLGAELRLDSRAPRPQAQTGGRVRLWGENTWRFEGGDNQGWVRYGGALEGLLDLTGEARVVGLGVSAELVDPVGTQPVPFFELAGPVGTGPLAGFRPGNLHDRSAAAAWLRYSWPVWVTLDGELTLGAGNVFGPQLDGLRAGLLRLSASLGIVTLEGDAASQPFELLVGVGTDPLDTGLRVSSFRLVLGAPL